jgi:phosphatidylserine decarboxylase
MIVESSHIFLNPQFLTPYACHQERSPCSCSVFSRACDMMRYFDVFCIFPVSAQLMTSSVKNLSQQNIRAAGSTATVSLAQVSITFCCLSGFLKVIL